MFVQTVFDLVGNTPLVALRRISQGLNGVSLFAKAEFLNPSGSVKDRAVKALILSGIEQGRLVGGKTIVDATSGNSGISYAMFGAAAGFPVTLYVPANASRERKAMMRYFGAAVVETDPLEGSDGAYLVARKAVFADPERWYYPDQYNNAENWKAHYQTTASEIWEQTARRVTHFVSGMGTSGTFTGTVKRLKMFSPAVQAVAVQPDSPFHGIEGTKHMASTIHPGFYDPALADRVLEINTEDAYAMTRQLAREEGFFVGVSSGANVAAALNLSAELPSGSVVVTVLCDSGSRYLSERFWGVQAQA